MNPITTTPTITPITIISCHQHDPKKGTFVLQMKTIHAYGCGFPSNCDCPDFTIFAKNPKDVQHIKAMPDAGDKFLKANPIFAHNHTVTLVGFRGKSFDVVSGTVIDLDFVKTLGSDVSCIIDKFHYICNYPKVLDAENIARANLAYYRALDKPIAQMHAEYNSKKIDSLKNERLTRMEKRSTATAIAATTSTDATAATSATTTSTDTELISIQIGPGASQIVKGLCRDGQTRSKRVKQLSEPEKRLLSEWHQATAATATAAATAATAATSTDATAAAATAAAATAAAATAATAAAATATSSSCTTEEIQEENLTIARVLLETKQEFEEKARQREEMEIAKLLKESEKTLIEDYQRRESELRKKADEIQARQKELERVLDLDDDLDDDLFDQDIDNDPELDQEL
jgi:hypothetical protein